MLLAQVGNGGFGGRCSLQFGKGGSVGGSVELVCGRVGRYCRVMVLVDGRLMVGQTVYLVHHGTILLASKQRSYMSFRPRTFLVLVQRLVPNCPPRRNGNLY